MPGHGYAPLPGPQPGATKHLVKISEIRDLYTDEISVPSLYVRSPGKTFVHKVVKKEILPRDLL
jgi:hypothetical protein